MAYRDGPRDLPNGWYLVKILSQSTNRHSFICEIVTVLATATGGDKGLYKHGVGQKIEAHLNSLFLHWKE